MNQPLASLCVLASGSEGNCTVLLAQSGGEPRLILIDAGLSPRRTRRALEQMDLALDHLHAIVLTHLDHDHWHAGWLKKIPSGASVWAHKRHAARGRRAGTLPGCTCAFDEGFALDDGAIRIGAVLGSHDELGVASFRVELTSSVGSAALGFATDVGRMRYELIEHLRGVEVLAIESNYCPQMQAASARPWFLKRRIMGGSGHLSNQEALEAVRLIEPREHVILLHLSRECNHPDLVASLHDGAPYRCTISNQFHPTQWVHIAPATPPADPPAVQLTLFGPPAAAPLISCMRNGPAGAL
jgi:phosphoribosyl 1,2-cyclic phosphodiesterase